MWSFTKWIPSQEDVEAELHALHLRYGAPVEVPATSWEPEIAFRLGFDAGMRWGAKKAGRTRIWTGVLPGEDIHVLEHEGKRYFARPPIRMNESEKAISAFAAGFYRGLAWETANASGISIEATEAAASRKAA